MSEQIRMETGKVIVQEHTTFEMAINAAYSEAANTIGLTFPVTVFRQGGRMILSGALPIGFVTTRLTTLSAKKGSSVRSALDAMNRPEDTKHTRAIAEYVRENVSRTYIMPPITLNVQERVTLHTIASGPSYKAGYLVIPAGVSLSITDGQHRVKGFIEAAEHLSRLNQDAVMNLMQDSIAVMITCEHDLMQIHQDFADCSKTKALPPSLLSMYDTRNPVNRIVFDLQQQCHLFSGRLDTTSKTLSKNSSFLFLANHLRQLVKHLIARSLPSDSDFERRIRKELATEEHYNKYLSKYIEYIDCITESIPVLQTISELPVDSPERGQIPKLRAEYVILTSTGMNVLGILGHDMFTKGVTNWRDYVRKLGDIDWRRTADIWQGNIVVLGSTIMASQPPSVRRAAIALKKAVGLEQANEAGVIQLTIK